MNENMKKESTDQEIARGSMAGRDCMKALAEKGVLAAVLRGCVPEYVGRDVREIERLFLEEPQAGAGALPGEGSVLSFRTLAPEKKGIISFAVHVDTERGLPPVSQGMYECTEFISRQNGTGPLQKVYAIWICVNLTQEDRNTLSLLRLSQSTLTGSIQVPKEAYDLMSVVLISLGDPGDVSNDTLGMLDILFSDRIVSEAEKQGTIKEKK